MLIDSERIGVRCMGGMSILADPYTKMKKTLVDIRCELNMVFHVRDGDAADSIGTP
jgi:hypothetical protein